VTTISVGTALAVKIGAFGVKPRWRTNMQINSVVRVKDDGSIGLSIAGKRGKIIGPGENNYDYTVLFALPNGASFTMWFNADELDEVEG
jgi:hypothetical protein